MDDAIDDESRGVSLYAVRRLVPAEAPLAERMLDQMPIDVGGDEIV